MSTSIKVAPLDEMGDYSKGIVVKLDKDTFRIWFDTHGLNRRIVIHTCNGPLQINPLDTNEIAISHISRDLT